MQNIVKVEKNELLVSLDDVAKFSGVQYESTQKMVRNSRKEFLELGLSLPKESDFKSVQLDEYQASFLITLMKNTPQVKQFKLELMKQFKKLSQFVCQVNKIQLEEKDKEIKTLKERRYAKRRHGDYQVVDRIRQDYNIDCTSKHLNDLLVQAGHLDIEWVTVPKYTPASECATGGAVPMVYVPELLKIVDKLGIKRDAGFEDSRPRLDFSDGE